MIIIRMLGRRCEREKMKNNIDNIENEKGWGRRGVRDEIGAAIMEIK